MYRPVGVDARSIVFAAHSRDLLAGARRDQKGLLVSELMLCLLLQMGYA